MFRHGRGRGDKDKMETFLGEGSFVSGRISCERSLRIDGRVDGEVHSDADIVVGATGGVQGDINGVNVTIGGKVNGNVKAADRLEMKRGAEVDGDVVYATIIIEEGVNFEGRCRSHQQAKQAGEEGHPPEAGELVLEDQDAAKESQGTSEGKGSGSTGVNIEFLKTFRTRKGKREE